MRVLVTGGAGYIGSHTVVELVAANHEVLVVDSFLNSSPVALERCAEITGKNVAHVTADIRDFDALDAAFADFKPEAVIHFAGLKAVGESTEQPVEYYDANISGTLMLLKAMDKHGCRKIVFSSSATVYGVPEYLPYDEKHPCAPMSPYGRTKRFIEEILGDWTVPNAAAQAVILRYFNPIGAHSSGLIGEDPKGIPNNLVPYITQVAIGRREALAVFGDDYDTRDGTGERDYVHVVDLARAHVAALNVVGSGPQVFNVGTGNGVTVKELIAVFEEVLQRPIPHNIEARRAGDIASFYADPSLANDKLGWQAQLDVREMCASAWTFQSHNPEGYS